MSRSNSSTTSSNIDPLTPAGAAPIIRKRSRRNSILDYGGVNSINNFASSVRRSVGYRSNSLDSTAAAAVASSVADTAGHYDETSPLYENAIEEEDHHEHAHDHAIVAGHGSSSSSAKDEDGNEFVVVSLKSTPLQSIFNSINVLMGIGILSVPLGFHLAGWILGPFFLLLTALSTCYTAILLGRIQSAFPNLRTYKDIAQYVFGDRISYLIFAIFSIDLWGASASMILLFSDSFNALFPALSPLVLKSALCTVLVGLNLLPLRILSFLSFTGILCTTFILVDIIVSGLCKTSAPGSLWDVMPTNLFPTSLYDLFFSIGLFMAPWGGHATFPEIYTDQQTPRKYPHCVNVTFTFCYTVDCITGIVGFLMFGSLVGDEVSRNILLTDGYPSSIKTSIVVLMGLLPISKLPLVSCPIVTLVDRLGQNKATGKIGKISLGRRIAGRIGVSAFFLITSLLVNNFGKMMAVLGSTNCLIISVTLPVLFYLNAFKDVLGSWERAMLIAIFLVSVTSTILGTAGVFLV